MLDNNIISKLKDELIVENDPFPHIAASNFLPIEIAKQAESEFNNFDKLINSGGYRYGNLHTNFTKLNEMPKTVREIITFCNSDSFLKLLGEKFNIKNVIPDWSLWAGGMHKSRRDGHLTIHSDYLYQRKTNTRRVLNLLLYLNSDWKDEWNGAIELWNKKMTKKVKSLSPLLNNVLIFETSKDSNHGYPEKLLCPENTSRNSIALYYYVKEKSRFPIQIKRRKYFTTEWKKRPNTNDPSFMDQDNIWRKIKYKFLPRIYLRKK